jgi:hypothetical protein
LYKHKALPRFRQEQVGRSSCQSMHAAEIRAIDRNHVAKNGHWFSLISTSRSLLYVRNRNQGESGGPEPYEYSEAAEKTWIPTPANDVSDWTTFQISSCNALAEFSGEKRWPEYKKPSVPANRSTNAGEEMVWNGVINRVLSG